MANVGTHGSLSRVAQLRVAAGLSQEAFIKKAGLTISCARWIEKARGKRGISLMIAWKAAKAIGVSLDTYAQAYFEDRGEA